MRWAGCACLALGAVSFGQVVQPEGTYPRMHPAHHHQQAAQAPTASQPVAAPVPTPAPTSASSLLDTPAQPAKVNLGGGNLAIQADKSSLIDILGQVTAASGMTIIGLGQDQRIFGSYGPGNPPEVILALLHGLRYNVVMVGETATGAPKELTLSPQGAGASSGPNQPQQPRQDEDNDDEVQAQPQPEPPPPPPTNQPPPGQQPNGGVRTPQQMLQELQQMRQMQQQQQQQQQQSPQ